ncbi:hypothetical protein BDR26DRAFT_897208 [Obelidium mucronatum]|nr:hypothetical protein BDR26DRAFT_897208 [Obelidium mucronatum]
MASSPRRRSSGRVIATPKPASTSASAKGAKDAKDAKSAKKKKDDSDTQKDNNASDNDNESEYEVEAILKHRQNKKTYNYEFLVKWKGYDDPNSNTWEPYENFVARDIIDVYVAQNIKETDSKDTKKRRLSARASADSGNSNSDTAVEDASSSSSKKPHSNETPRPSQTSTDTYIPVPEHVESEDNWELFIDRIQTITWIDRNSDDDSYNNLQAVIFWNKDVASDAEGDEVSSLVPLDVVLEKLGRTLCS